MVNFDFNYLSGTKNKKFLLNDNLTSLQMIFLFQVALSHHHSYRDCVEVPPMWNSTHQANSCICISIATEKMSLKAFKPYLLELQDLVFNFNIECFLVK